MADTDQEPIDETPEEQQVRDKQLLEGLDREAELAGLAQILGQETVRDFLWRVLSRCGIYSSTFNRNFGDMALAEGRRELGLWLLSEICEADPTAEMLMRKKSVERAHALARADRQKKTARGRRNS